MSEIDAAWRHCWSYLMLLCVDSSECHLHNCYFRHSIDNFSNLISIIHTSSVPHSQVIGRESYGTPKLMTSCGIRYVGVSWFVFHNPELLLIIFTLQNLCRISKSMVKHPQKANWKQDFPWFKYSYRQCIFADIFIEHMGSPNVIHYWT
jgi:hypothetical protein